MELNQVLKPFKFILRFFNALLSIGARADEEPHQVLLIRAINLIFIFCIISGVAAVVLRALIIGEGDISQYYVDVFLVLFGVVGLYFNYKQYYDVASALATIGLATALFIAYLSYDNIDGSSADLIYLPLAITAPLTFRRKKLGIVAFVVILAEMVYMIQTSPNPIEPSFLFILILTICGMLGVTYTFINHLSRSADELREKNKVQEHLLAENKLRQELFGILCHDLKGPTAGFNNLSKKVAFLLKEERYAELQKYGDYFEKAGDKIFYDIDRLLNWTISQKEKIVIREKEFILTELIENITHNVQLHFRDKKVDFDIAIPEQLTLNTDDHILEIILKNLLVNAAKYTDDGMVVSVTSEFLDDGLRIVINNPGAVIDMDTVTQAKLGKYRKSKTGHGLGLGICYSLVQFLNGEITFDIESRPGTTAILDLPNM